MPRLTIVIPCLGGAAEFDGTLVSVLQHRPADCEIVVVHREAYDDPYDLAGEVRFIEQGEARSLAALANVGLAAAQGDVLHLLACGLEATEGWTDAPLAILEDEEIAAVAPAIVAPAPREDGAAPQAGRPSGAEPSSRARSNRASGGATRGGGLGGLACVRKRGSRYRPPRTLAGPLRARRRRFSLGFS